MLIGVTNRFTQTDVFNQKLLDKGVKFHFFNTLNEDDFDENILRKIDVLFVWSTKITDKTAAKLSSCKLVVTFGIGYDHIDVESLVKRNIKFTNNPSYGVEEVADSAVGMILDGTRKISQYNNLLKKYSEHLWKTNSLDSWRSSKRTVGIIGVGKIGTATILRLKSFNFKVIAYDPYIEQGLAKSLGITITNKIDDLLKQSDVVSLHCPLTKDTKAMIDKSFLEKMKNDAILVNTARGQILESLEVLETHMRENHKFKAFLDVLPDEPPLNCSLIESWKNGDEWLNERLVINPHSAFYSDFSHIDMRTDINNTAYRFLFENEEIREICKNS